MTSEPLELTSAGADHPPGTGVVRFIGTATTLLRLGGFTVLTDPNFLHKGDHAKLGGGLRSRRLTDPAMEISHLPPLDFVVLSHHHGDHFDEVAARDLDTSVPIITTAHAARKLGRQGFGNAIALGTWETQAVGRGGERVTVTAMPAKHAPQPLGALLPPVMGSLLTYESAGRAPFRLYISGDTLVHDALHEIPRRHPDIDLALLHLGGTRVLGILLTMDGAQGVRALEIIRPRTAVPIHFDDYTVFTSPLSDFRHAVEGSTTLDTTVRYLDRGESHVFDVREAEPPGR